MKREQYFLLLVCTLIGIAFGLPRLAVAQGPLPTPTAVAPEVVLAQAQDALRQAQMTNDSATHAVDTVNTMLGFLQVVGLVITAAGVPFVLVGAATGLRAINDYRSQLEEVRKDAEDSHTKLEQARTDLEQAEAELDSMRSEMGDEIQKRRETLDAFEMTITQKMDGMLRQGDNAIRSLALLQLGRQQINTHDLDTALKILLEAHALDPESAAANYFLGDVYIRRGDPDKGIQFLEQAMHGEDYAPMQAALAYALRMKGEREPEANKRNRYYAQAEELWLKILESNPRLRDINGEAMVGSLAGLYRRQGRLDDAIRCYEQAERVTPESSYPVSKLGLLHAQQGNPARAKYFFERTAIVAARNLDGDPFDSWARFDMVTAQIALGKMDEALNTLDSVVDYAFDITASERFSEGLDTLKQIPNPPQGLEKVIARAQQVFEENKLNWQ